ncbi:MAG: hypothetical protein LAO55_27185 [Acidobacteriia bacterium]|nr:hypothetical protein [Terriglobia bacterium]
MKKVSRTFRAWATMTLDSDLRRWGLKLAQRGGRNAKKRAVMAMARKLAVLLGDRGRHSDGSTH